MATVPPGVTVGDSGIAHRRRIASPFAVAGNSARVVKMRFDLATVARLTAIAWRAPRAVYISRHGDAIRDADIDRLERVARSG